MERTEIKAKIVESINKAKRGELSDNAAAEEIFDVFRHDLSDTFGSVVKSFGLGSKVATGIQALAKERDGKKSASSH